MYAIKTEVTDPKASVWCFARQKTMYGGKNVAAGDTIFVFASENEGGIGLVAKGVVTSVQATPRIECVERQAPRISIAVKRTNLAKRKLGRTELKPFTVWSDGQPETELRSRRPATACAAAGASPRTLGVTNRRLASRSILTYENLA
jgi:hypothetical protein